MPLVQDGYNSSGGKNYRIVSDPKSTPVKTYIYKPSTINGVPANGSTRIIVRDAKTGELISDTGYLNKEGTGAGAGVTLQEVIQAQRSGSSPLQTQPDWNKVSVRQIKTAGYNTLSEYKNAYNQGLAISPSNLPETPKATVTKTTSQKLTEKLSSSTNTGTSNFIFNFDTKNNSIPCLIPNQDVPLITELGIFNIEKQVTLNKLNSPQYQTTLEKLKRLCFDAENEARLKTNSPAADVFNPEALAQRQIFYAEEKRAGDQKRLDALNKEVIKFDTDYRLFQADYASRDLDPTTPEIELTEKNYDDFIFKNKAFEAQITILDKQQKEVESLFTARTTFKNELDAMKNDPIIQACFDPTTPLSEGARAGVTEFQRIETEKEYAGTPAQKAFAGKPKNLLTAVLMIPQICSEQFKQTGTKTTTNPYLDNKFINPALKDFFSTTTPIYTNIFDDKQITDINAPKTYEEELEFKKQIGLRAGLQTARDPYDLQDLTKDLEIFRNDVLIGTVTGGVVGSIVPTIGTVVGATTGGLTGAVGGATNVITSNIVERQTGSEFLGESLGTVTGIGAELISAGAVSKAVVKTISANPRLMGNPISIAYDMGGDKLRVIRYSEFKTGTGFLTRKFDIIDDVIIERSDLLKNLTIDQAEAIFKQATNAPKFLTDDVIKGRINIGKSTQTTDITQYMGEFTKASTKKIPLNELLEKLDLTEFSGVQRISVRTGKDLLTKIKTSVKPTIYDDSIESVTGFGKVREAEKAILIKKGTKTFQFEGYGLSYSEADKLADTITKAQKGVKTGVKKITDLKLIGNSKYASIKEPEQIYCLNPKQTSTGLQEDVIFLKAKQKGTRLFTNDADDYSKFISLTRQKGFSKTCTFQGDETIISPTIKFKSETLTFAGSKGKGQIIRTSIKGMPDDYMLRIASPADDLPKGTIFTKATVSKAGGKVDDILGLNSVGMKPAKDIKLLAEPLSEARLDKAKPKIKPKDTTLIKNSGNTLTIQRTKTITSDLTKKATKNITETLLPTNGRSTTQTLSLTKTKPATDTLSGTRTDNYARSKQATDYAKARTQTRQLYAQPQLRLQAIRNISKYTTAQRVGMKSITMTATKEQTKTRTKTDTKTDVLTRTDTKQAVLQDTATLTDTRTNTKTDVLTRTDTKQAVLQDTATRTDTRTDTKTQTATATTTALITATPTINPFITVPTFKIPRIKLPFIPNQQGQLKQKTKLYIAQVREKQNTRWKTVTKKPMPYNKAYNEGLDVADNTIAQSVRIIYKKQVKKFLPDDPSIRDFKFRNKKYKSKIPSNPVKIEKRKYAIDTLGEKQGLSVAKYLAQKKRSNKIKQTFINNKGISFL